MEPKRLLYPLEQQLKFSILETEVNFLLQQMQDIKQGLYSSSNINKTKKIIITYL